MVAPADLQRFQEVLREARSYLILLPQNPNFDSVAAGLAFSLALTAQGKDTGVASPSPMTVEFNRLVGVNKVTQNLGDKNLSISFDNYRPEDIEKVSYNIENGKFNLVVIPKPGFTAPTADRVRIDYAGGSAQVVIVVGAEHRNSLGKFAGNNEIFNDNIKLVLLGNTPAQGFKNPIELIDPQASSNSEVVFQIIEGLGWSFDADLAGNLFMGLRAGTNNFQNGNVRPETFAAASRLMQSGATVRLQSQQPQPVQPQRQQPLGQTNQAQEKPPQDWLAPKVYKGSTLP